MNKLISGKLFFILFIITNAIYTVMVAWSISRLMAYTNGLPVFDMRIMGYSYAEAVLLLDSLGPIGIEFYKTVQLPIDFVYPFFFMITYSIGCIWVYRRLNWWKPIGRIGAIMSIIAGLCDYIENIHLYNILNSYPSINKDFIFSSNMATILKSITTTFAITIFMIGFFRWLYVICVTRQS